MDKVLAQLQGRLGQTLAVVISKSGGTKETRNGMLEAEAAWTCAGLDFARHAVAITGLGSELDKVAASKGWLRRFPMWDWVGGRTSELCAVGLLPAALQGLDIDAMLAGAKGPFKNLLVIGIGGSALGPQFVATALGQPATDKMSVFFFDNTDPDGMDKVLAQLRGKLAQTLAIVISKSGGTKESPSNRPWPMLLAAVSKRTPINKPMAVNKLTELTARRKIARPSWGRQRTAWAN